MAQRQLNIMVIGATGMAGSAIVREAIKRGHTVQAVARSREKLQALGKLGEQVRVKTIDAFKLTDDDLEGVDALVDAFATAPNNAQLHVDLARRLIGLLRDRQASEPSGSQIRAVFILGAGSLLTGDDHHPFVRDMEANPANRAFIAIPQQQAKELEFLRSVSAPSDPDWVGVSPSAKFYDGPAATPNLGDGLLLTDTQGRSQVSSGTMAVAILDEIEHPAHRRTRFTVRDGE